MDGWSYTTTNHNGDGDQLVETEPSLQIEQLDRKERFTHVLEKT